MSNYSKFIASIVGSGVAVIVVWLAGHVPFITTCTAAGAAETCTTLGLTTVQLTATVVAGVSAFFVWLFPPNQA